MKGPRVRRALRVVIGLVAALALAGCAGLVSSRQVQPGLEVGSGGGQPVRVVFPGPTEGASQEQVLRGFLRATGASDGVYSTAGEFLTPDARTRWSGDADIHVYDAALGLRVEPVDVGTVRLAATMVATIGADGRYAAARPGSVRTSTVRFARIAGQWRISELPKDFGRWLVSADLPRLVRPYAVHYLALDRRVLVPDVRWFPLDHLATRLARAQLAPVPDYLAGVARTEVPVGSRLTAESVTVRGGVAQVDLSGRVPPDATVRQNVWAQLTTTLAQDPSVDAVSLSVGGASLDLPDVEGPVRNAVDVGFPPPPLLPTDVLPVVRRGAAVSRFDPTPGIVREPRSEGEPYPPVPAGFTGLALSADGKEVAALDPDGRGLSRWKGRSRYQVPFFGVEVSNPSYDQRGFLWAGAVATGSVARLWVIDTRKDPSVPDSSAARPVEATWLAGRVVREVRVATDGERVAVLSTDARGGGARIDVSGVVRAADGTPQRLAAALPVGGGLGAARGLVWVDDRTLATIARGTPSGALRPHLVGLGGEHTGLPPISGPHAITSIGSERGIFVVTTAKQLFARTGQQWSPRGGGSDLAVPGA